MTTVCKIKFGSHLYGTNTPASDTDYKSVHIPPADDILLQRVQRNVANKREKAPGEKNTTEDVDDTSYSLDYFLELLASGQTVAIDMLFAPQPEITTPLWQHIQANSSRLLTKQATVFLGYCRKQANKYGIKGSRVAAARAASEGFKWLYDVHPQSKVGEHKEPIEALIRANPDHMTIVVYEDEKKGKTETYFEVCNRKVPFTASVKLAAEIFTKIFENYGDRARLAESNDGIDWKALSHAVRVGEEAIELMATGKITFPLRNRDHILAIKQGKVPFAEVSKEIEDLLDTVEKSAPVSILRDKADIEWIDKASADSVSRSGLEDGNAVKPEYTIRQLVFATPAHRPVFEIRWVFTPTGKPGNTLKLADRVMYVHFDTDEPHNWTRMEKATCVSVEGFIPA